MRIDIKGVIIPNDDKWIYDWFEIESTCPKEVNDAIEKANGEKLDIYINSGGGDIFAGSEIYTAIRNYNGQAEAHVTGIAASSASIILCACKSEISPTAQVMVHNVTSYAGGDYHDMDKMSEILQNCNDALASAYCTKTGMSKEEALAMMDKETWLTAEKAVEIGLVDKIMESKNIQLVASIGNMMIPQEVINKMRNQRAEEVNADFLLAKTQAKLNLLKLGGKEID
jgi:ATP-dependent Clp protease protease subunit